MKNTPIEHLKNREAYKNFYEKLAEKYNNNGINEQYGRIRFFKEHFRGRILELGCQTGGVTRILAKYADEVIAWDVAEGCIQKAKERSKKFKNIKFICGFAEDIKYKDEFDVVILFEILEHVFDAQLVVSLSMNVLKEGGDLFFSVPLESQILNGLGEHVRNFNITMIKNLFKDWKYDIWLLSSDNPQFIIGRVKK